MSLLKNVIACLSFYLQAYPAQSCLMELYQGWSILCRVKTLVYLTLVRATSPVITPDSIRFGQTLN